MNVPQYDAIVIGSGAGGAAAAYRLVSGGMRVLLLEKGGHLPNDGSTLDVRRVVHDGEYLSREPWLDGNGRKITPEEHFNVGGKTKWYGAALFRFGSNEFLSEPEHACLGWPISLTELEPYYEQAERLLGVRTFDCEPDLAAILKRLHGAGSGWQSSPMPMGLSSDIVNDPTEAAHFDGFASVKSLKGEAETSILSQLDARTNFTLLPNAEVEALLGHPDSSATVVGVRLCDGRTFYAPRVLLAAGALHSPRLLSRYLSESGLNSTLPAAVLVGRYVKLHLLTAMVSVSLGTKTDLIRKTTVLINERFTHSSVQPLGFDAALIETLMPRFLPGVLRRAVAKRAYGFFLQTEDGSHLANRVQQGTPPVLDYDEARSPGAAREHQRFTRAFQAALLKAGLISFTKRIGLNGTAHVCGSLVCGRSASDSVVDASGQVHGMTGLYVVDGSVLPRSSRVNPSLTIYAWGLKVADALVRRFQPLSSVRSQVGSEAAYAE
jgi:choline dehydrogenase-like flavoprotein